MRYPTIALLALGAGALMSVQGAAPALAGGGHHGRGGSGLALFETFDTNRDGKLTQAEIDAVRTGRFTAFDKDGDGKLTLQEYELLWVDAMRPRMVDRFQGHDDDGDGAVTIEEFSEGYARIVYRLDANGDGEITRDELRARRGERRDGDDDD
jgi:Ca2+-binding EF-hand superfamily protein